jgi:hypothetical protein
MTDKQNELQQRIAEMQRELKTLQDQESKAKRDALKAFTRQWRFTIKPYDAKLDRIYDDTLVWYYLRGELLNADEYKALGGDVERSNGGMAYLYNTLTKRIVMSGGGGNLYIPSGWNRSEQESIQDTFIKLAAFIADNPNGGDVTAIIISQPDFKW